MAVRVNFTFPDEVFEALRAEVEERGRSAFVTEAVRARLTELARARLAREMIEGYQERFEEDQAMAEEWDPISLQASSGVDD